VATALTDAPLTKLPDAHVPLMGGLSATLPPAPTPETVSDRQAANVGTRLTGAAGMVKTIEEEVLLSLPLHCAKVCALVLGEAVTVTAALATYQCAAHPTLLGGVFVALPPVTVEDKVSG